MKSTLSFYERGSTWTWHLAWYEDGKRRQSKKGGFPSKREARKAGEAEVQRMAALGWRSETKDTVAAWLETWLDSLAVIGRKRSTIAGYRHTLNSYVMGRLGDRKLREIDTVTLDRLYAELQGCGGKDGKPLSARTVRYVHSIRHKALADAVRKGLLTNDPAEYASAPSSRAARAPEVNPWTPIELATFLDLTREDYYWPGPGGPWPSPVCVEPRLAVCAGATSTSEPRR